MIIEGGLIGPAIDQTFFDQRRSPSDFWEEDQSNMLFGGTGNLIHEAKNLFKNCYLPSILEGADTALFDGTNYCAHDNRN